MRRRVGVAGAVRAVVEVEGVLEVWGCGVGGADAVATKGGTM